MENTETYVLKRINTLSEIIDTVWVVICVVTILMA